MSAGSANPTRRAPPLVPGTLTGFKNRISVLFDWTIAFLSEGRAQRAITKQQVFARQALEERTFVTDKT